MKNVIFFLVTVFLLGCSHQEPKSDIKMTMEQVDLVAPKIEWEEYVSLTCEKGDITLSLDGGDFFKMIILWWDSKTGKHTGKDSISGKWRKHGKDLELKASDGNVIKYSMTTTKMNIKDKEVVCPTYGFRSNSKEFFGTSYDLLERKQADSFFMATMK